MSSQIIVVWHSDHGSSYLYSRLAIYQGRGRDGFVG